MSHFDNAAQRLAYGGIRMTVRGICSGQINPEYPTP